MPAKILIVDDQPANLSLLNDALEPAGYHILAARSGTAAIQTAQRSRPDLILLDVMMPGLDGFETCRQLKLEAATRDIPVIFITARDEMDNLVEGFRVGGVDYLTKPVQTEELLIRVKTHLKIHFLTEQLKQKNAELEEQICRREKAEEEASSLVRREAERWNLDRLIGESEQMAKVKSDIRKLQAFPATNVLITGESGTGKELIARAIHYGSPLAGRPFVPVNCSAVPAELAESAFFGHVKGAFTGATSDRKGYFELADGGTLFLDEVGDMPLSLQIKLLRVLEDGVVVPLGGTKSKKVSVRIVAGTNADLHSEISAKTFRKDLYFRLAGYAMEVPPLRQRPEDIPLLADHFMNVLTGQMGMSKVVFSEAARNKLVAFDYPGNVRELRNIIERALIESGGGTIKEEHLRFESATGTSQRLPDHGSEIGFEPKAPLAKRPLRFAADSDESKVLEYIRKHGAINNTECRALLNVGLQRACYLLRKLHRMELVQRKFSGKAAEYHLD